ncbi:Na+/H+ antiporter subunit A [Paenibacillus sp. 598K]|uniref:Na+/H+ antiporter subunit A n=1 Tax=Paenibacillus sp. 598K TaxID=1117987 RepID=UPI000FFEE943|nr:Na+/H+ antiporter subunit A [Paenibacillus sp. 598K]
MSMLHGVILLPFAAAAIVPLFYKLFKKVHTGWFVLPVPLLAFLYFIAELPSISKGEAIQATVEWIPSLGVDITAYLDGLGLLFALLITGIGALVVLYSIYYLSKEKEAIHRFYMYLLLFMGAMLGVVLSDNLIVLYGFWELTSLSSFLLIAFWYNRDHSRYGALKSMLITVFGGFAMLTGFILLHTMTGTFSLREIIDQAGLLSSHELFAPAMILVLLGAFTKSAQFPFHIWLPDAMEAPTPVSAYLHSATMVKAGLYIVARFGVVFGGDALWFWIVSLTGLVTMLWGSYTAVRNTDLKAILAYSTISQLGLIMSLLGLGSASFYTGGADTAIYTAAIMTAVFHLINHATFKGALFMVVGIVDHETGTRDIRKLGGLMAFMPVTFTFALIGTLSMAGLPPFNGFLSKEMFFTALLEVSTMDFFNVQSWALLFPVVAWIASVFTFVYCLIILFRTFTGPFPKEELGEPPHEASLGLLIPPGILAALVIVFGLFPNLLTYTLIEPAMKAILPTLDIVEAKKISFWHGFNTELKMTLGVIALGVVLFLTKRYWMRIYGYLPGNLSFSKIYDFLLKGSQRFSRAITDTYMTGSLRHYMIYIFAFLVLVGGYFLLRINPFERHGNIVFAEITVYEAILTGVLILAAAAVPFAKSRMAAIVLVGTVGYMVTLFFIVFRAPDLALTQMIVETVSVALFLLCFYHLPKLQRERSSSRMRIFKIILSGSVGLLVTMIALAVSNHQLFDSISDYFVEESYRSAGGKNIVNVILVDFRGFDTFLEIMVLAAASLAIYSLIKVRHRTEQGEQEEGRS